MKKFRSSISDSISAKVIRNMVSIPIVYLTGSSVNYLALLPFNLGLFGIILQIILIYLILLVLQIHITNNDLIIREKEITIQSSLFKKLRRRSFNKDEISEIIFKDEWSESFMSSQYSSIVRLITLNLILFWFIPWEYKWIQIKTKDNKRYTYYFFGLNYDFHDNSDEILFEDMFIELARNNIKVKWKSTKDNYFEGLQKDADEILQLN